MFKFFTKLIIILSFINITNAKAEIIANKSVSNKNFGIWKISCEEDVMLQQVRCKFFTEITEGSILFINSENHNNLVTIISKDIVNNTNMLVKVDGNSLIKSEIVRENPYNVLNFSIENKKQIFKQLKNGNDIFFRFLIQDLGEKDGKKEITVRLDLSQFRSALLYYDSKVGIISNNKNELQIGNFKKISEEEVKKISIKTPENKKPITQKKSTDNKKINNTKKANINKKTTKVVNEKKIDNVSKKKTEVVIEKKIDENKIDDVNKNTTETVNEKNINTSTTEDVETIK